MVHRSSASQRFDIATAQNKQCWLRTDGIGGQALPPLPPSFARVFGGKFGGARANVLASRPLAFSASLFAYRTGFGCRGYSASSLVPSPIGGVRVLSALPLRAPPLLRAWLWIAVQVQGHFSLAGVSLASPPLVRALRLQISAIHCRALRGSPALRRQCPALRFAAHSSPSHPNPHPLPLSPSHSPRGLTASGRLAASCSRRLSPLRFARLLLQVAISPPFALIGGGPLN